MVFCRRFISQISPILTFSSLSGPKLAGRKTDVKRNFQRSMATRLSKEELTQLPGVAKKLDPATKDFVFQQTMFRVKDLKRSLDFYTRILGFTVLDKLDFEEAKFSLVFLGQASQSEIPEDPTDRVEWMFKRPNCLELTYNWGSEESSKEPYYYNGNDDPEKQGYGHIGFEVPDVEAACKRFDELGVEFVKRPNDGKMRGLAFIKDPDSYWIEIFNGHASRAFVQ